MYKPWIFVLLTLQKFTTTAVFIQHECTCPSTCLVNRIKNHFCFRVISQQLSNISAHVDCVNNEDQLRSNILWGWHTLCYYTYIQHSSLLSLTVHALMTIYVLVNHCLTRWAVTLCPTYGDCRAAIKHFQVGFFTLSSWFSHASITCRPRSSLLWELSSWFRVGASNPSLSPSFQYLLAVRSVNCSRTSSRSSIAKQLQ